MTINYGFNLEEQLNAEQDPRAWRFGASAIIENITIDNLDWRQYFSAGVRQHGVYFDTMACVSFSAVRIQEAIFNAKIRLGLISAENLQWLKDKGYIDEKGEVNFSERYIAKLSKTTKQGNSGWAVNEAIKEFGLIPNFLWPFADTQRTPVYVWENFYAEIPAELIALGKEFIKRFSFKYELISTSPSEMKRGLKHSPIQVYVYAWDKPVNGVHLKVNKTINHAISNACPEWFIQDHYLDFNNDFEKQLAPDYIFYASGYKYNWTENNIKNMTNVKVIKDANSPAVGFWCPANNPEGLIAMARNYGIEIPKRADGSIEWDKLIQGTLILK